MKKFTLLFSALLMVSFLALAQIKLVVYKSDGSEIELLAAEVDSIGFKGIDVKPDDSDKPGDTENPDEDELVLPIPIPAGHAKFIFTLTGENPGKDIIFTGNFAEKAWAESDRVMTKQADGTYVWEGDYPENFRFKVLVKDAVGIGNANYNGDLWMEGDDVVVKAESGSIIRFKGCFEGLCSIDDLDEVDPDEVISEPTGYENGYGYVDLGLPSGTMWATMNVGANSPEGYGDYYAWGETTTKSTYEWGNYKLCNGYYITKYCTDSYYGIVDNKTELGLVDDAAYVNRGGDWRMPTKEEQDELRNECAWVWTTLNGVYGYKVTSKVNDNSIFLPAAGYCFNSDLYYTGLTAYYWGSSLCTDDSFKAYFLHFNSSDVGCTPDSRDYGHSVRPVMRQGSIFAVSLDNNGGEGAMQSIAVKKENQFTIPENEFTRSGYEFKGWNTKADGTGISYVKGDKITITSNITLYAQWISIYQETGISNGHGYVDLGLPSGTMWATMNVGANSPEGYGDYYAWGETETKSSYTLDNYKWYDVDNQRYTKYNVKTKQPSLEGYSILVNGADFYEMTYEGFWGVDNSFVLYSLKGIPLRAGDTFVFHSNEDGNTWASAIVDEGGVSDIEGTGTEFNVISRGCYSIYLKLKFTDDHVYFGEGICGSNPTLDLTDDAAYVNWGSSWRIPTEEELDELRNTSYTTWTWTTLNGINGYKVTSKINGNSIFLPAAGYRFGSSLHYTDILGYYWGSSLYAYDSDKACGLNFKFDSVDSYNDYRDHGKSIRPVLR